MVYLRIATGLGLVVVSFTEKLADPALAQAFLHRYPLNLTAGERAMKTFGASAPLKGLQKKFGFKPERVAAAAKDLLAGR
jgi:transketolase